MPIQIINLYKCVRLSNEMKLQSSFICTFSKDNISLSLIFSIILYYLKTLNTDKTHVNQIIHFLQVVNDRNNGSKNQQLPERCKTNPDRVTMRPDCLRMY